MENIIHPEFFEEMSSAMKHIYLAYSAAGGALHENYTTNKFKYSFGCLIGFQYISATASFVMVIIQQQGSDIQVIVNCLMYSFFIHVLLVKALVIYWKRNTFRALFDQMSKFKDNEFVKPTFNYDTDQIEEINIENSNIKAVIYVLEHTLALYSFKLLEKILTYAYSGEFIIDYQWDFVLPVPSVVDLKTFTGYFLVHCLVFLINLIIPLLIYGSIFLPLLLSVHLKNLAIRLQNDIKYHSDLTSECMEECDRREEKILNESPKCENVRNFQLRDIQCQRDRHIREFMHKVRQWIKYHQRWISCANLFKECVPHLLSVHVAACYAGIVGPGCNIAKIILDSKDMGYENFSHLTVNTINLLAACVLANVLPEMSDDISIAIYCTPWYYLSVSDQKVLLQFLFLAQNNPTIHIFKVFPLSLEQFPGLLNDAYGYVQLTRALEMKAK